MAIANFYAEAFLEDARMLGLKVAFEVVERPDLMPRPSMMVPEMVTLIETLIERDHAYVAADGVVYFDVQSFPDYGRLSGNTLDAVRSGEGGRVDMATQAVKRNPADFMLWKPDSKHLMRWPSPWGEGYPGWHLECSVMAREILGDVIDLTGGEDNIFPHHECESSPVMRDRRGFLRSLLVPHETSHGGWKQDEQVGRYVLHHPRSDRSRRVSGGYPSRIGRTHYRVNSNFTFQGLKDAQRQVERWRRLDSWLEANAQTHRPSPGPLEAAWPRFLEALGNDLNMAGAIGVLSEAAGDVPMHDQVVDEGDGTWSIDRDVLTRMNHVLGVLDLESEVAAAAGDLDVEWIESQLTARVEARDRKDWSAADQIRDALLEQGIEIKDGAGGTTWKRIVQ